MTDLHILHPYAALPTPIDYDRPPGIQLAIRRIHEGEETKVLVKELLSALPGLYRVGMGRNFVWERQTRWKEDGADGFHVQRLPKAEVPSFYDAGSSVPLIDPEDVDDQRPVVGATLMLLEGL